ncbi:MAG: ABC transporter permease [Myxococcota bacterium]
MRGLRALWADRAARPAVLTLALLLGSAVFADLLASDLPLAVRVDGQTHLLPCLTRPAALRGRTQATLSPIAEWMIGTPIPYGPEQTIATTGEVRDGAPPWGPDERHWLGTDDVGRDVFARLIHGARVSLFIAFFTVLIAVGVGMLVGGVSGYAGGATDAVLSRVLEVMTTFPLVFFLIALLSVLRTQSLWPLVLALGLTRWTDVARLVRAEVLKLKTLDFVLAARAMGASPSRIIFRHLLPNALGPVLVTATFGVAAAVLLETGLSFLGLGVAPPTASWGELLTQAHRTLVHPGAWWLAVFPGACIALTVLSVNALGEALRRKVDGGA